MSKSVTLTESKMKMHHLFNSNYGAFIQSSGKLQFYKTYVELPQDAIISHPDHVNTISRSQLGFRTFCYL